MDIKTLFVGVAIMASVGLFSNTVLVLTDALAFSWDNSWGNWFSQSVSQSETKTQSCTASGSTVSGACNQVNIQQQANTQGNTYP